MTPEQKRRLVERMLQSLEATRPGSVEERRSLAALELLENTPEAAEPAPRAKAPRPSAPAPALKQTHARRQRAPEVILAPRAPVFDASPLRAVQPAARDALEKERLEGVKLPAPGSELELTDKYQTAKQLAARYRVSIVTVHRWLQALPAQTYSSALIRASKRGPLSVGYKLPEENDAQPKRRR